MKNKIANMVIAFGVTSSLFTVFRLYHYFFTGNDFSPLSAETKVPVTIAILLITGLAYFVGYGMKGKL